MAAKPKTKSKRGGPRPGSGRPTKDVTKLRAEIVAETEKVICDALPQLIRNMITLANGGYERIEDKFEAPEEAVLVPKGGKRPPKPDLVLVERKVTIAEPDRGANQYLIDRILGKPKQQVDVNDISDAQSEANPAAAAAALKAALDAPDA